MLSGSTHMQSKRSDADIKRVTVVALAVMLVFVAALVVCVATAATSVAAGKVYDRCELARELQQEHELPQSQVATWVCIARYESEYNTSAFNPSSRDHGLFQISELFWCSEDGFGGACALPCSALRDDDISDDVTCARRIYREHTRLSGDGFNAWVVYPLHCKQGAEKFVEGCFTDKAEDNLVKQYPETTTVFTTTSRYRSRYFSNVAKNRGYVTTTTVKPTYSSRSNVQYNKITTQKSTFKPLDIKNNIFSRQIHKPHKFIEHPTGDRYKYHINKSGFSLFKDD